MSVRRECCIYCMWLGPVNQDGTMRKHRPATSEDRYGRKVQNRHEDYCQGSHKPYARFGNETVVDPREEAETEAAEVDEKDEDPGPSLDDYAKASRIIQSLIPGVRR
ncbi:hypothetical protein [Streptomyces sp. NPDC059753]|uniref:hypothetical protein n=1 Tax=Streptomyces sp. NPDC059753 TaxID=3346933 RepID=UPI00365A1682